MQWCELAKQGIDEFTFEDRLFTINLLNVTGLVERGETPDQDIIIVHGYLPTGRVEVAPLMSGAIKRFGYHAFPAACGAT